MKVLSLDYIPTDLNTYINAERKNKFIAAKIKKEETDRIYFYCLEQSIKPIIKPVYINFEYYTINLKKDPDNLSFCKKFILDGLVKANVLKNDGRKQILGFNDRFFLSDKNKLNVIFK